MRDQKGTIKGSKAFASGRTIRALWSVAVFLVAALTLAPQPALAQDSFTEAWVQGLQPREAGPSIESALQIQVGALTFFTNQVAWAAVCPNLPVEDFENPLLGGVCGDASHSSAGGTCYAAGELIPGFSMTASFGPVVTLSPFAFGVNSVVAGANTFVRDTQISFSPTVTGVGVEVESPIAPGTPITMNVFAPGNVFLGAAAVVVPATPGSQFFGVFSPQPVAQVTFTGFEGELFDNLSFGSCFLPVKIDLKPESNPNCVIPGRRGVVSVATFGNDVDVADIDQSTLDFGGASAVRCATEDTPMEGPTGVFTTDGIPDLVCKFRRQEVTWPAAGSDCGTVGLTGVLFDGTAIQGSDTACLAGEPTCNASTPIPVP